MKNVKQIIVIRRDLKCRRGKEIAQGSHASMAFLVDHVINGTPLTEDAKYWLDDKFTKICVYVQSEAELDEIHQRALDSGLISHMIIDSGRTEFHGVETKTAVAIGPHEHEILQTITGHLPLY